MKMFFLFLITIILPVCTMEVPKVEPATQLELELFDAIDDLDEKKVEELLKQQIDLTKAVFYRGRLLEPYMFAKKREGEEYYRTIASMISKALFELPVTKQFFEAAQKGDIDTIKKEKSETLLNIQNEDGNTAPMLAIQNGHVSAVQEFLGGVKYYIDIFQTNYRGDSLLTLAIKNPNIQIIEAILPLVPSLSGVKDLAQKIQNDSLKKSVLDLLKIAQDRITLNEKIKKGEIAEVEKLITSDALLKNITSVDRHPLVVAIRSGNLDIVKLLVNKDPSIVNQKLTHYNTPLIVAVSSAPRGDQFFSNKGGEKQKGDALLEIIKFLLEKGADPNASDIQFNQPALSFAVNKGPYEIMKILVQYKANIDYQNPFDGFTALMEAASNGYIYPVKELLALGANPLMKNAYGQVAYELAKHFFPDNTAMYDILVLSTLSADLIRLIHDFTQTLKALENTLTVHA